MEQADVRANKAVEQFSASGGVNQYFQPHQLTDTQFVRGLNTESRRGQWEKRKGYTNELNVTVGTVAHKLNGVHRVYGGNDGAQTVQILDDAGGTVAFDLAGTATSIGTVGAGAAGTPGVAVWKRNMWITSQSAGLQKWDMLNAGTLAAAAAGPATNCKYLLLWRQANVLVASGSVDADKQGIVYFSDLGLPETWPVNNFFHIPEDMTGDRVQGLANMPGGELLILGEQTLGLLYGRVRSDFYHRTVDWQNGCVAPHSIVETPLGVFYASQDGFYLYDGGAGAEEVGRAVEDEFDDIADKTSIVAQYIDDDRVLVSYRSTAAGGSVNDRVLVYNLPRSRDSLGTWDGPWTYGFNGVAWAHGQGDGGEIYAASPASDSQIRRLEQNFDDAGTGYGMEITGREHYLARDPRQEILELVVSADTANATTLSVEVGTDGREFEPTDFNFTLDKLGVWSGDRDRESVTRSRADHDYILEALDRRAARTVQLRFKTSSNKVKHVVRGYRITSKARNQ